MPKMLGLEVNVNDEGQVVLLQECVIHHEHRVFLTPEQIPYVIQWLQQVAAEARAKQVSGA